jgi:hypothetical protein
MVKLVLLFGFSACAYAGTIAITGGGFGLDPFEVSWGLGGDGFSASGADDHFTSHCGFCYAPFQLVNPVVGSVSAFNGGLTFGGKYYMLPSLAFFGDTPWAVGSVFFGPQAPLPMVTGAGTYDVPFIVSASFCVTDNPPVPPPFPPDPACFSASGTAIAHYTVIATTTPNAFFQPAPTVSVVTPVTIDTPEPGTLSVGMLVILLMLAAKCRAKSSIPHFSNRD